MFNLNLVKYILKLPLAIPHLVLFSICDKTQKERILLDIEVMNRRCNKKEGLSYYLIERKPYRNLFYYRLPQARFFKLLLPEYILFTIVQGCDFDGGAFVLNHPFSTIINARKIGKNFTCCHLTTIGNGKHGDNSVLPSIGDNVSLGANVTIIGNVKIGNNVVIGAGSVVVKDIPDNCIAVGNPARIIRKKEPYE